MFLFTSCFLNTFAPTNSPFQRPLTLRLGKIFVTVLHGATILATRRILIMGIGTLVGIEMAWRGENVPDPHSLFSLDFLTDEQTHALNKELDTLAHLLLSIMAEALEIILLAPLPGRFCGMKLLRCQALPVSCAI